ncbi:MAG TPA: hypothetical protein VHM92_01920 [Allosphingosinicella sp.]|nr:hypothetical protein [Allosphingosinicella sp.]
MKMVLFAAAMMLGSAAVAQTGNTVDDPSQASGPRGVTQQGTDPEGQACTPPGYNAGTSAYPPCGGDMATTGTGTGMGTGSSAGSMPACSKTVTDHCIQTYERGVRRSRR